jgi:hypothetical protein
MVQRKPSSASLRAKRKRLLAKLPDRERILRGSIVERYRKCGKPGCHCATGKGHGPAYYLSVTLGVGETRSYYLPARLRKIVGRYLHNFKKLRQLTEKLVEINLDLLERRELEPAE